MPIKPKGAVAEYVAGLIKGPVTLFEQQLTLGAGITQLLPNDPERVFMYFINLSAGELFVSPFSQPSATKGIFLGPSGGAMSIDITEDFQLCSHPWYVYSAAAANAAYILYGRRETKYLEES